MCPQRGCPSSPNVGSGSQRAIVLDLVKQIEMRRDRVSIILRSQTLRAMLSHGHPEREQADTETPGKDECRLDLPVRFKRRGVEMKLVITDEREQPPAPDPHLIAAAAQGRTWLAQIRAREVQSVELRAARLVRLSNLPASWEDQRRLLGFGR